VFDRLFLPMLLCMFTRRRTVRKPRLFSCGDGCRKPSRMDDPGAVPPNAAR
jgi:hypothetical protein